MSVSLSVVIPTRNRSTSLHRGLGLLRREIEQHALERTVEIIVVDDDSTPALTSSDLLSSGVRLIRVSPRQGAAGARNAGIAASSGASIAFLDDDIVPSEDYLRQTLAFHRDHPQVLVVNGDLRPLRDDVYSRFWFEQYDAAFNRRGELYPIAMFSSGHCSIKRELLASEYPLFDASLPTREDTDLCLRLQRRGVVTYKCDKIVAYNDCRSSLAAFIRQYAGYAAGQQLLERKHGSQPVGRPAARKRRVSWRLIHLYAVLRCVRLAVRLRPTVWGGSGG